MKRFALILAVLFSSVLHGRSEVEVQADGTYLLTGTWMFWPEKEILAPYGRFDRGEFAAVVFKPAVNDFEGVRALERTPATLRVRARINPGENDGKVLVVTEIVEIVRPDSQSGD